MKNKLKDYVNGVVNYTHQMNIILNNRPTRNSDSYADLGRYILDKLGDLTKKDKWISLYTNRLDSGLKLDNTTLSGISMMFITASLDESSLKLMFGDPINHNSFGEGFDEEEKQGYQYSSYFVNVGGVNLHIGYDHRGTSVEVEDNTSYSDTIGAIKALVDIYKEKVLL